jgi:hypothetical protein
MQTYEFIIVASGLDPAQEESLDRFYEAGCDDATVAFQNGHIIVDFAREAETLDDAIASAVTDVTKAGAKVGHVESEPAKKELPPEAYSYDEPIEKETVAAIQRKADKALDKQQWTVIERLGDGAKR